MTAERKSFDPCSSIYFNQNQYDALFSFAYSNGAYVLTDEVYKDWTGKGGSLEYDYKNRREAEARLFMSE